MKFLKFLLNLAINIVALLLFVCYAIALAGAIMFTLFAFVFFGTAGLYLSAFILIVWISICLIAHLIENFRLVRR